MGGLFCLFCRVQLRSPLLVMMDFWRVPLAEEIDDPPEIQETPTEAKTIAKAKEIVEPGPAGLFREVLEGRGPKQNIASEKTSYGNSKPNKDWLPKEEYEKRRREQAQQHHQQWGHG